MDPLILDDELPFGTLITETQETVWARQDLRELMERFWRFIDTL